MSDMNFVSSVQLSKELNIPHRKLKELIRKHKVSVMGMGLQQIAGEGKQRVVLINKEKVNDLLSSAMKPLTRKKKKKTTDKTDDKKKG
jgi:hypothetical protein